MLANLKIIQLLCLIPCAWALIAHFGGLDKLENALLDLRFRFRGDLVVEDGEVPQFGDSNKSTGKAFPKVFYVDFDQRALSSPEAGERPWDRKFFADVASILLDDRVGARVVGYDFIFSNKSMSKMVLEENVFASEQAIGDLVARHPGKVVLGANYTNVNFEFNGTKIHSSAPLIYREEFDRTMASNYPEAPTYPMLFYKDGKPRGRLGILFAEMNRGKGPVPRWAPLLFPYEGDAHAKRQLLAHKFAHPIEKKMTRADASLSMARKEAKQQGERHQLLQALGASAKAVEKAAGELAQIKSVIALTPNSAISLQGAATAKLAALEEAKKQQQSLLAVLGNQDLSEIQLDSELELARLKRLLAEERLATAMVKENSIPRKSFARLDLSFQHDTKKEQWLLMEGATVVQRIPSVRENPHFFHFSIAMILAAYELDWKNVEISPSKLIIRDKGKNVIVETDLVDGQLLEVNWFSRWKKGNAASGAHLTDPFNPRCSIIEVFEKAEIFFHEEILEMMANYESNLAKIDHEIANANARDLPYLEGEKKGLMEAKADFEIAEDFFANFQDAMVLVGPVDPTFQDLAPTPFDDNPVPKVGFHGNLIKTLLTGKYIQRPPPWIEYAGIFGLGLLMIFLGFHTGSLSNWARPFGIALQIVYLLVAFLAFKHGHWALPVAGPVGSALSVSFAVFAVRLVIEEKAKGRIKGMFGTYVSQELVEQMVDSGEEPSLGGEETAITAFFSDVQSFSSFSELLTPNQLVALMNEYLTAMTDLVQVERGTLDKYIGDAIVAMYGAPIPMEDHAYQAVKTALLMQERQMELREKWQAEGDKWPSIVSLMQTRIGCNTGTATVGNMGSTDRFNYTMMGDMVNLAARCESGAKSYGAYVMVTDETKRAAEITKDDVAYRYLDKIVVKGRTEPVIMYEPVGFKDNLQQKTQDCLSCFQAGIDQYLQQDWAGALKAFEKAKGLELNQPGVTPGVQDNPSMILIDRCKVMKENPPDDDWDGVFVMTSK
jgi:class 3 adenylate cyclase/CHASE2 domain-containing sensor protein